MKSSFSTWLWASLLTFRLLFTIATAYRRRQRQFGSITTPSSWTSRISNTPSCRTCLETFFRSWMSTKSQLKQLSKVTTLQLLNNSDELSEESSSSTACLLDLWKILKTFSIKSQNLVRKFSKGERSSKSHQQSGLLNQLFKQITLLSEISMGAKSKKSLLPMPQKRFLFTTHRSLCIFTELRQAWSMDYLILQTLQSVGLDWLKQMKYLIACLFSMRT